MYTHINIQNMKAKEDRGPEWTQLATILFSSFPARQRLLPPSSGHLPSVHVCVHVWTHTLWPIPVPKAKSTFKRGGVERKGTEGEIGGGGRKKGEVQRGR